MTLTANAEGKLCVCRQLEDYMFRPVEFETMNFLNYTVETYERQATRTQADYDEDVENNVSNQTRNDCARYMIPHSKANRKEAKNYDTNKLKSGYLTDL